MDIDSYHDQLIKQERERIEFDYMKARSQEIAQPVVFVLHLSSPLSQVILQVVCSPEQIQAQIAEAARRGMEPIACWPMSNTAASGLLRNDAFAIAEQVLGPWPEDIIVVVCVSEAGVSLGCLPSLDPERRGS